MPVAVGAFAGAGVVGGGGSSSDGALKSGTDSSPYAEIDGGWVVAGGGGTTLDPCKITGASGGAPLKRLPGVGYGFGFGAGKSYTATGVSQTLGSIWSTLTEIFHH